MSDEIKAGDIRISGSGDELKVLAVDGNNLWAKWDGEPTPRTNSMTWALQWTKPKLDFFEEKEVYQHTLSKNRYEVLRVIEVDGENFAIVKPFEANRVLLLAQDHWSPGYYKKI